MKIVVGSLEYRFVVFLVLTRWACLSAEEVISTSWSNMRRVSYNIPLVKQQFVINHQFANWDSCVTRQLGYKHTSCQCCIHKRAHIFVKKHDMLKCWSVNELFFSVSCKAVYRQVRINCCFMSDLFHLKCKAVMFILSLGSFFICTDSEMEKGKECVLQPLPTRRHRHTLKRGFFIWCSYT
jgi:hypothetical protein